MKSEFIYCSLFKLLNKTTPLISTFIPNKAQSAWSISVNSKVNRISALLGISCLVWGQGMRLMLSSCGSVSECMLAMCTDTYKTKCMGLWGKPE